MHYEQTRTVRIEQVYRCEIRTYCVRVQVRVTDYETMHESSQAASKHSMWW